MIWQDSFCLAPFHEWSKEDNASWQIMQASFTAFMTNYSTRVHPRGGATASPTPQKKLNLKKRKFCIH